MTQEKVPERYIKAEVLKGSQKVNLPTMGGWNYDQPLRSFQERGVAWLYLVEKGLLADSVGMGKAQPLDAQILTPTGFRVMGNLAIGDRVIGGNGRMAVVVAIYPQGERDVYKLTFSDGSVAHSTKDHLWPIISKARKEEGFHNPLPRTLSTVLEQGLVNNQGHRKHFIPLVKPVEFDPVILPLHPYLLGALLGDGGISRGVLFTTADEEMADFVSDFLPPGVRLRHKSEIEYSIVGVGSVKPKSNVVLNILRDLGLHGAHSDTKFIPQMYLQASVSDRVALLQGLLDTDGTIEATGNCVIYTTVSPELSEGVVFLAQSLGGTAIVRTEKTTGKPAYDLTVSLPDGILPFRLSRKAARYYPDGVTRKYRPRRALVSVEFVGRQLTQCIQVDSIDGLYVTNDFVVTHNTAMALGLLTMLKHKGQPYRAIVIAPNYSSQVQWLEEIRKFTDLIGVGSNGTKSERVSQFSTWWDILVTRYPLVLRDISYLRSQDVAVLIADEASIFRHHEIKTAHAVKLLASNLKRVVLMDATPIQTALTDMHSLLETFRMGILGTLPAFEGTYVRREPVKFRRGRRWIQTSKIIGYRNMKQFKKIVSPFILRRQLSEVEVDMPEASSQNVWLDLPKRQRNLYDDARRGVIKIWETPDDEKQKVFSEGQRAINRSLRIRAGFHHLQFACDSSSAFGDEGEDIVSVKGDWVVNLLTNALRNDKVVIFAKYKRIVSYIMDILAAARIGARRFTGDESGEDRVANIKAFWDDPQVRVLVGTSALERGLNLQTSAYMIAFDQMWNPQRVQQLLGRIQRIGSKHPKVVLINLLTTNTMEEKMQHLQSERAALPDYVFGEESDIFEQLSDQQLVNLIQE